MNPQRAQALDCIEWIRVFRMRYETELDIGSLNGAAVIEDLFHSMWNGHGGECSSRWHAIIGAPVEDGGKVLNQESPYECLRTWLEGAEP